VVDGMVQKQLGKTTVERQPEMMAQVRQMILHAPVSGVIGALEAMKQRPDSRPLLPALGRIPVLIMVGEEDLLTPPDASRAMADAIPGAELEVVPEAGHLTPLEQPEVVTERLQAFLTRLNSDSTATQQREA